MRDRAAKRRERRRHRLELRRREARQDRTDQHRKGPFDLLDGFDLLDNETGDVGLHVECGFTYDRCKLNAVFNMGTTHHNEERFTTDETSIDVWWANRFWIEFRNEAFKPVWTEVAVGGSAHYSNCYGIGRIVLPKHDMPQHEFINVDLGDRYYVDLQREVDTGYKNFQVWFRRYPLPP